MTTSSFRSSGVCLTKKLTVDDISLVRSFWVCSKLRRPKVAWLDTGLTMQPSYCISISLFHFSYWQLCTIVHNVRSISWLADWRWMLCWSTEGIYYCTSIPPTNCALPANVSGKHDESQTCQPAYSDAVMAIAYPYDILLTNSSISTFCIYNEIHLTR